MRETCEPVLIEAFIAELAVERLDIRVLRRLARLTQFQHHAIGVGPLVESSTRKLRSLVRSHRVVRVAPEPPFAVACRSYRPNERASEIGNLITMLRLPAQTWVPRKG